MAINVIEWVWNHSRSKHDSRLVLLAIADNASSNGKEAWASVKEIMRKANCGERSVRTAIGTLEAMGELIVHRNAGPGGVNRYEIVMGLYGDGGRSAATGSDGPPGADGAESAPPQNQQDCGFSTPAESAPPPPEDPFAQAGGPSGADSAGPADFAPRQDQHQGPAESAHVTVHEPEVKSSTKTSRSKRGRNDGRGDAQRLCEHLAGRIEDNGSLRPRITKEWMDAARLMLDNDGRTEERVHRAIDWCQGNEFWRRNILSMPKLREQYDRLRMQAEDERRRQQGGSSRTSPASGPDRARGWMAAGRAFAEAAERAGKEIPI
jgi:Helix-turn-helix domain